MKQLEQMVSKTGVKLGLGLGLLAMPMITFADGQNLTTMVTSVKGQMGAVATLLNVAAYVAGVGFALGGILQFKAHKENPQQTPLSKPIVMIIVSACLLFLPTVINIAGQSLFGSEQKSSATFSSPLGGS
jgi:intracellular multiplication protein IcmD